MIHTREPLVTALIFRAAWQMSRICLCTHAQTRTECTGRRAIMVKKLRSRALQHFCASSVQRAACRILMTAIFSELFHSGMNWLGLNGPSVAVTLRKHGFHIDSQLCEKIQLKCLKGWSNSTLYYRVKGQRDCDIIMFCHHPSCRFFNTSGVIRTMCHIWSDTEWLMTNLGPHLETVLIG